MTGQEIKTDRNAIKYIGTISDEGLNAIIEIHNKEDFEEKNKLSVVRENIKKVLDSDDLELFFARIDKIEDSEMMVVARTIEQAKQLVSCSGYTIELLKQYSKTLEKNSETSVNVSVGTITDKNLQKLISSDSELEKIVDRDTFSTKLLLDSDFSINTVNKLLDKVEQINDMSESDRKDAVNLLLSNDKIAEKLQDSVKHFTGKSVKEVLDDIKESRGKNVKPTRNIIN